MYRNNKKAPQEWDGVHEITVRRVSKGKRNPTPVKYRARCPCGYRSRAMEIPSDAVRVGSNHVNGKNKKAEE